MIGFVQPLLLVAAAAAAIPIVLHLIRRQQARRVTFPAVRYLRRAEQRHARRLRLRHLLLLALRVSLIVLAAAAAAGPLIGPGGPADHRPTALAIILDNSLSTTAVLDDDHLFRALLDRATESVRLTGPDDRAALFPAADPAHTVITRGSDDLAASIRDLQPVPDIADLPGAIARAGEWLRSAGEERAPEIHLLTDGQSTSLAGHNPGDPLVRPLDRLTVVIHVPELEDPGNGTLADPQPEALPFILAQEARLSVSLHWFGTDRQPAEPVVMRLVHQGRIVGATEAAFGSVGLLSFTPDVPGWIQGYVEIDRHGLSADDRRYFTWSARPPPRVRVAGRPGPFLEEALSALARGDRLRRVVGEPAEVLIAGAGEGLEDAAARGATAIVIPPGSALELPRLNARLERAGIPWRYESATGRGATRLEAPQAMERLADPEVRLVYALRPEGVAARDTVLIRTTDGEPWLIRGVTPRGSAHLLLASPLVPEATELPVSAAMVPFIDALIGEWARRGEHAGTHFTGVDPIRLPDRARRLEGEGVSRPVEPGSWFHPAAAGNYSVLDGDSILLAFSVNPPLEESDRTQAPRKAFEDLLPEADWTWVGDDDPAAWTEAIYRARRGRLAWRPVVALLLLFAILESTLAASGRRRDTTAAGSKSNDF